MLLQVNHYGLGEKNGTLFIFYLSSKNRIFTTILITCLEFSCSIHEKRYASHDEQTGLTGKYNNALCRRTGLFRCEQPPLVDDRKFGNMSVFFIPNAEIFVNIVIQTL